MIEVCRVPAILVLCLFLIAPFCRVFCLLNFITNPNYQWNQLHSCASTPAVAHFSLDPFTSRSLLCSATPDSSSSITQLALVFNPLLAQSLIDHFKSRSIPGSRRSDQRYVAAAPAHPHDHRSISHHVQLFPFLLLAVIDTHHGSTSFPTTR